MVVRASRDFGNSPRVREKLFSSPLRQTVSDSRPVANYPLRPWRSCAPDMSIVSDGCQEILQTGSMPLWWRQTSGRS
jgi:hypothetical protein